ncbi:MAG: YbfB/YjiJ family MFS transporter [Proteobacteria bacterium]|nr:YbfB/YjiJ family MFS transporter [Pseudomonadota bacterium]
MAIGLGISRFVYTPILPLMETGYGLSKPEAGLLASANFLGYLLGALFAALGKLPGSSRTWFISALTICALTTMAMGWASSMETFLFLRFSGGVGAAFVMVFASTLILQRLAQAGRPGLSALHFAGVGTGIAISSVLIGLLSLTETSWQGMWIWTGVLSFALLVPVIWMVPTGSEKAPAGESAGGFSLRKPLVALIVAYGLLGFGYVITATFISTLVRQFPDIPSMGTLTWLIVGIAAIPSVAFWTWLARKIGNGHSYAVANIVLAVGVAGSVLGHSAAAIFTSAALLGATFMGLTALGLINAREMSGGDPRRSIALMTASFGLGQMLGPVFAGYAYDFGNSFLFPSLVAALSLVIAALLVFFFREKTGS